MRPHLVSQSSETYEQAQEDEREVLKAIFMDDYEESEAKGAWSVSNRTQYLWRNKSVSGLADDTQDIEHALT